MKKLQLVELMEKEMLTVEELELVEESEFIEKTENCGCSGQYVGKTWYVATTTDGKEYNLYI